MSDNASQIQIVHYATQTLHASFSCAFPHLPGAMVRNIGHRHVCFSCFVERSTLWRAQLTHFMLLFHAFLASARATVAKHDATMRRMPTNSAGSHPRSTSTIRISRMELCCKMFHWNQCRCLPQVPLRLLVVGVEGKSFGAF